MMFSAKCVSSAALSVAALLAALTGMQAAAQDAKPASKAAAAPAARTAPLTGSGAQADKSGAVRDDQDRRLCRRTCRKDGRAAAQGVEERRTIP